MTKLDGIYDVDIMEDGHPAKDGYAGVTVVIDGQTLMLRGDDDKVHVLKPGQCAEISPVH